MDKRPVYKIAYDMRDKTAFMIYENGKLGERIKVTLSSQRRLSEISCNHNFRVSLGFDLVFIDRKPEWMK